MTPERWQQIRDVLAKALSLAPEQRSAFLIQACASDTSLRQEVDTLLASSNDVRSNFLESCPLPAALTPGTKLGEYEIVAPLGSGGMGEVYRACDSRLGREVAIKVLPVLLSADGDRLRRFEQEARAAAALNHPNILAVHQLGTHDGAPYMVSELLEGDTLRGLLKRGRLAVRKAIDYGVQVARGLAAAHEKGIVHRDLKPENLFVTKHGRVKILDFGLAKLTQRNASSDPGAGAATERGVVMGTVGYMAPEQVRGETADHRADVFAFGAILYEMLAGVRAFQKPTSPETMTAILNEDPPSISQVTTSIPAGLQRVVHRCLEKNPEQRFQSASDLAFALEALSEGSDSGAAAASARNTKRQANTSLKRVAWGVGAVLLVVVALGVAWKFWRRTPVASSPITLRQLTANAADNPVLSAVLSRDGRYLAYSDRDGIAMQEVDTGENHRLKGTVGLFVQDWYPDGAHLLVTDDADVLWKLFAFSGEKQKLAEEVIAAALSPDGSQILLSRQALTRELWSISSDGSGLQRRFALEGSFITDAAWSPDSKAIAYIRNYDNLPSGAIEVRQLQGGEAQVLYTNDQLNCGGGNAIRWPSNDRILVSMCRSKNILESDLWSLSLNSSPTVAGNPVRLTNTMGSSIAGSRNSPLSSSADGKRLAMSFGRMSNPLFLADLSDGDTRLERPERLTNGTSHNWARAWTGDSQTLFYLSSSIGEKNTRIHKRDVASGQATLVVGGDQRYWSAAMSPDGKWLLITLAQDSPIQRLLRVPVSGGPAETVFTMDGFGLVQCAPTGFRICVLSERVGKQIVFSAVDPLRGRLDRLATLDSPTSIAWGLSADGGKIAAVENGSDSVKILGLQTKEVGVLRLDPPRKNLQMVAWSADGKRLFVSAFPDLKGQLLRMDENGHNEVLLQNPYAWIGCPLPSPDGKHIAYTSGIIETNVSLLEHF